MNCGNSSPSEFEFDAYATALDSSAALSRKVRRQYGKSNSQKKKARNALRNERILRRTESDPVYLEERSLTPTLEGSSSSSLSTELRPALPSKSGPHVRSKSVTGTSTSTIRLQMRRNNSLSIVNRSSGLRHSSSSSLNSDFEHEYENFDPNIITQELLGGSAFDSPSVMPCKLRPPLSTMDEHPKARPRKIRALSDLGDLQRSFSDLAREADAATGWDDATPKSFTSMAFDFVDFETSSPHGSVATMSSRKRSVSDSTGVDEFLSDLGSQGGGGIRGSKSRSRIYSPEFAPMLENVSSLKDPQSHNVQRGQQPAIDSDDGGENDSDDGMVSEDKSFDCDDFINDEHVQGGVARPPQRFRRSSSDNFEEFVFGAASALGDKVLSDEGIVQSMPSVEDLRFIIKNLRKAKKGAVTTFGMITTWTVSLPRQWTSDRRAKVLHWSTQQLGFSMRTGGPSVVFLNVAASKAPTLLSLLESALTYYRNQHPAFVNSKPLGGQQPIIFPQASPPPSLSQALQPRGFREPSGIDSRDDELVHALSSLSVSSADRPQVEGASRLVRTVTVDPNNDCHPAAPPRHSGEYFMGGTDLVSHIHVTSPRISRGRLSSNARPSTSRRPRLLVEIDLRSNIVSSPFARRSKAALIQHSVEGLETPHMTRRACWERQKNGRDWGASSRCCSAILRELTGRFECALAGGDGQLDDGSSSVYEAKLVRVSLGINRSMEEVDEESDLESSASKSEIQDAFDDYDFNLVAPARGKSRRSSIGADAFADLNLNELDGLNDEERVMRRRLESMAKHKRVSLCASGLSARKSIRSSRSSYFSNLPRLSMVGSTLTLTDSNRFSFLPLQMTSVVENHEPIIDENKLSDPKILLAIFSFLNEQELLCRTSLVCTQWADASTEAHANLMLLSVGCAESEDCDDDLDDDAEEALKAESVTASMEQPWKYLINQYPHACFLSGGAFKNVYKVFNISTQSYEALSVMDIERIESTGNKHVVGAELAVSAMLSSLVRRNVCPNFVVTRRVFTCPYEPPKAFWGSEDDRKPRGGKYSPRRCQGRKPREPGVKHRSRYQYIRMELCAEGDAEEYLKRQPDESISPEVARNLIFQVAFAMHAAADRFSLKHYDLKLLNIFLQKVPGVDAELTTLRYGLGSHIFALEMPTASAIIAKVADYGTANVQAESNGQPATIGQFTTLENTPPEFMILGDAATQGHGHDAFGLGLCMLHLFTGHAPYEEILADVTCPSALKAKLQGIWEDERSEGYSVIRSVILADVYKDEAGAVIEGEPDGTLYDTFYRYLVLFGIPDKKYKEKAHGRVWKAIASALEGGGKARTYGRNACRNKGADFEQFEEDQKEYSLRHGTNSFISRAREGLEKVSGGLDLLFSLVDFDPEKRATACDVLNSQFMIPLREEPAKIRTITDSNPSNHAISFMAYATQ